MLNLTKLVEELKDKTEWQETPMPLTDDQYMGMIVRALERLFVDTGRAVEYDETKYVEVPINGESSDTPDDSQEESEEPVVSYYGYDADFLLDEKLYIMLCAQMEFFRKVQSDVNNAFGYTTDALSVTHADKPYENLKDTVGSLDNERRIIYYKMVRYTLGVN